MDAEQLQSERDGINHAINFEDNTFIEQQRK